MSILTTMPLRPFLVIVSCIFQHITVTQPPVPEVSSKDKVHGPIQGLKYSLMLQSFALSLFKFNVWLIVVGEVLSHLIAFYSSTYPSNGIFNTLYSLLIPSAARSTSKPDNFGQISPLFLLGVLLSILSGTLRQLCYSTLGRFFTFQHTTRPNHELITSGPYAYARHPSYTAFALLPAASALVALSSGSWMVECGVFRSYALIRYMYLLYLLLISATTVVLFVRAGREDRKLKEEFGKEWDEYAKRVPWKFFPYVL